MYGYQSGDRAGRGDGVSVRRAGPPRGEQIDSITERCNAKKLRLDFEGVPFMDSSGIGLIMGRYRMMQMLGGQLHISGASERLWSIMRLAGLERLPIV